MLRTLAGYDVSRYPEVLRWPLLEALESYQHRLRDQVRQQYEIACQVWASLAATGATKRKRPPEPPAILRD